MKYILLGYLAIILCACHAATAVRSDSKSTIAAPQQRNNVASQNSEDAASQRLEGLYFGVSDNQLGRRAWLFRLDPQTGRGSLYIPPNNLELSHIEAKPTGRLTFHSDVGLGDVTYSFDGQVTSDGIKGKFYIARARPSAKEEIGSAMVTLRKLDAQPSHERQAANISGLYSNVDYNEEGGDLTGEELIIIPDREGLIGIFTSYENEMLPYAAVNITQSQDGIQFRTRTETGEETYRGTLSPKKITLRRNDTNANAGAEPMVLFKKKEMLEILAKGEASQP